MELCTVSRVQREPVVVGLVLDSRDLTPLEGVTVVVEGLDAHDRQLSGLSAADGSFRFALVASGRYSISLYYANGSISDTVAIEEGGKLIVKAVFHPEGGDLHLLGSLARP